MKCSICQSETPPQYPHGITAFICHTCKALGRVIEAAFSPDSVEPEMPASEIEAPKAAEAVQESTQDAQTAQEPASEPVEPDPQGEQNGDQEPTGSSEPEQPVEQTTVTEAEQRKRKTKKLK